MKKILLLLVAIYSLSIAKVSVGDTIPQFNIKDQNGVEHQIKPTTKKIVFVFKKATGHIAKDFFQKKGKKFLEDNNILFVADVSGMPTIIKYFVLPIKGYDYPILTLDDEDVASKYKDEKYEDKIMVITLENMKVVGVDYTTNLEDIIK